MKKYNIIIKSEAHCKAVQTRLFELGYLWFGAGRTFYNSDIAKELRTDATGIITYSTHPSNPPSSYTVATLNDLYNIESPTILDLGDNVEVEIYEDSDKVTISSGTQIKSVLGISKEAVITLAEHLKNNENPEEKKFTIAELYNKLKENEAVIIKRQHPFNEISVENLKKTINE
jgi:hypothetical protein